MVHFLLLSVPLLTFNLLVGKQQILATSGADSRPPTHARCGVASPIISAVDAAAFDGTEGVLRSSLVSQPSIDLSFLFVVIYPNTVSRCECSTPRMCCHRCSLASRRRMGPWTRRMQTAPAIPTSQVTCEDDRFLSGPGSNDEESTSFHRALKRFHLRKPPAEERERERERERSAFQKRKRERQRRGEGDVFVCVKILVELDQLIIVIYMRCRSKRKEERGKGGRAMDRLTEADDDA
ncbi:hypothetical protein B296_00030197 [Ensete ventricosum]|uniref:IBB domain-containing protein n=1 Tax=Ensete ventricosum TaxID=4639 RepID=A0A426Y1Z8_ENSVE|nr:hypothetical protein B296_00030197 [Ensete ventricosum]